MDSALQSSLKTKKPAVTIRTSPSCLSKYKSLGSGYTGIMADALDYVAENPEILAKAQNARKNGARHNIYDVPGHVLFTFYPENQSNSHPGAVYA